MQKKHLVNIMWKLNSTHRYCFTGYVTTKEIDPNKLFFKLFGFVPDRAEITYG